MAKLPRVFQKIFGSTAGTNQISQFGSLAAGTPQFTTDPTTIQSLSNFMKGWYNAVVGQNSPPIQDMNALFYLITYQLAQMFQDGLPEWDASTTYYLGSLVNNGTGVTFACINDSAGAGITNEPLSNMTFWAAQSVAAPNSILNGGFDFFQRGSTITAANNLTRSFTYTADRWATWCSSGSGSVVTANQISPVLPGSGNGLQVAISTAPGSATAVGPQLFHILDNVDSLPYYGGLASFGVQVMALGNVTHVSVQFIYNTTKSGVAAGFSTIGSPVSVVVNSSTFALASILGQAMGTAQTMDGVVGVVITATAVSTGHLSDLGNGFTIEQAIMVPGTAIPPFKRAFQSSSSELAAIQAYFEKSFNQGVTPEDTQIEGTAFWSALSSSNSTNNIFYKTTKRDQVSGGSNPIPDIQFFNPLSSGANKIRNNTASTNLAANIIASSGTGGFYFEATGSFSASDELETQWTADAEIY